MQSSMRESIQTIQLLRLLNEIATLQDIDSNREEHSKNIG